MQYSFATAISTILFASTLSSAAVLPRQSGTMVTVQFKNGDGDASVQQTFMAGQLVTTQINGLPITNAVNGQIVDQGDKCQFFSDAKGTQKIGGVLSSEDTSPVQFTDASTGGTDSVASQAVPLGSVLCATAAQFDTLSGMFTSGGNSAPSAPSNAKVFPVRIQISGLSEAAAQVEIPADGQPHALVGPVIGIDATDASIVHTHKAVECQAADVQGKALGGAFEVGKDVDFGVPSGVTVTSVTCKQLSA